MSLNLIRLYNRYVAQLTNDVPAKRKGFIGETTVARVEQAKELAAWLKDKGYPAAEYLASCFGQGYWRRKPPFEDLTADGYRIHFLDNRSEAADWALAYGPPPEVEPTLSPGKEILKKSFRARESEELCRGQPELSGGFNEESEICQTCRLRTECSGDTPV